MRSCCSTPRTAVAGARSATSAQAPCRSTKRSSASATIHISWTCARPTVDLLQRIDAKQECRSLETTGNYLSGAPHDRDHPVDIGFQPVERCGDQECIVDRSAHLDACLGGGDRRYPHRLGT